MTRFIEQGTGINAKPHLLTARINGWGGIVWSIECPYEGSRDCGSLEECHGTPEQREKYRCSERPVPPSDVMPVTWGIHQADPGAKEAWDDYHEALDQWRDEHDNDGFHRTEECWFELVLREDWFDSEGYLTDLDNEIVVSPMRVLVGYEGSGEDTEPKFTLWKEEGNADS